MRTAKVDMKVWGEYACFTRPEFKVERVSYPVMTPGAARGVLEAIYWKPEFRYRVLEIGILRLGRQMSILRNEISDRQTPLSVGKEAGGGPFFIDDKRQQRMSLILTDVAYVIRALICVKPHVPHPAPKYLECFYRRVDRGQCHHTPYLGAREFSAYFARPESNDKPDEGLCFPVGTMLLDTAYVPCSGEWDTTFFCHDRGGAREEVRGKAVRLMFAASVNRGVMTIPQEKYDEIDAVEVENAPSTG